MLWFKDYYSKTMPTSLSTGFFIVIEGIDGSGKTTLASRLSEALRKKGYPVVDCYRSYFPQTKELLDVARRLAKPASHVIGLAYALDYFLQMDLLILPAVQSGKIVISDRYIFSSIAYNTAFGLNREWNRVVYESSLLPDRVFYLDVTPEVALQRRQDQDPLSRAINQDFISYQHQVRQVYLDLSTEYNFAILDANASSDAILAEVLATLDFSYP